MWNKLLITLTCVLGSSHLSPPVCPAINYKVVNLKGNASTPGAHPTPRPLFPGLSCNLHHLLFSQIPFSLLTPLHTSRLIILISITCLPWCLVTN